MKEGGDEFSARCCWADIYDALPFPRVGKGKTRVGMVIVQAFCDSLQYCIGRVAICESLKHCNMVIAVNRDKESRLPVLDKYGAGNHIK